MKKRVLSVLLAAVTLVCSFTFSFSAFAADSYSSGTYLVTGKDGVNLYPNLEETLDFSITAPRGAYLNIIKTAGDFGYTVYESVYGWVKLTSGIEYISSMPTAKGEKIEGAKGIKIAKLPDKLTYIEGEESADIDGMDVSLVFDDAGGSEMAVTGYSVEFPNLDTYGEKTVTVYYGGFRAHFTVNVVKVPVTGIVITFPKKTAYVEGEAVSFDGLTVTAFYSDGRDLGKGKLLSRDEYTVSGVAEGDTTLKPGTYEVTVTYKYPGISASFHIYVSGRSVVSLSLLKMPSDMTLYQGQTFNKDDFELVALYDNGLTETITDFDIEYDNMTVGTSTARIYYMDKYVAFDYTVLPLEETGIELGDTANVGSYVGENISFKNLKVYVVYNSGEKKLTEDYDVIHGIDTEAAGVYPVTVFRNEFSASFDYTVAVRTLAVIGDVNLDGKVNAADARLALRRAAKLEDLSDEAFAAADVNFDGEVTASDARKILRVSANLDSF